MALLDQGPATWARNWLAASLISLHVTATWAAPPVYRITLLDLPEGYVSSSVVDISPRGEVLGELMQLVPAVGKCVFTWRSTHGMRLCANVRPWEDVMVGAINQDGVVAGTFVGANRKYRPFTHARNGDIVRLERMPGASGIPSGINDLGEVVGDNYLRRERRAAVWRPGAGLVDMHPDGFESSDAHGINKWGQIVVDLRLPNDMYATLIEPDGDYTLLSCLDNIPGNCSASAWAVNDHSQVVGESHYTYDKVKSHAFIWTATQGMSSLTAGGAYEEASSYARDINNRGETVGAVSGRINGDLVNGAFRWSAAHGPALLADLIDPADPLIGRIKLSNGPNIFISDRGAIALDGYLDGSYSSRALVLTPRD